MKRFWRERWTFEVCYNLYAFAAGTLMLEAYYNSTRMGAVMRETFQQTADDVWRLIPAPRLMNNVVFRVQIIEDVVLFKENRNYLFENFRTVEEE